MRRAVALLAGFTLLAACSQDAETPEAAPSEAATAAPAVKPNPANTTANAVASADAAEATPMEERVATIGLLNKRNNVSQDLEMKPGEERVVGDVILRLAACERTAPWEMPRETGALFSCSCASGAKKAATARCFQAGCSRTRPA